MTLDISRLIGAVTREVKDVEYDGKPAKVVVATRSYDTTQDDLWDALTNPDRIPRWFLPISGTLELGGRYQLEGNAGGEITECEPPKHFAVTWEMHGQVSWVDVQLLDDHTQNGILLRLEHTAHVPKEFWDQFGPGAVGVGWDLALMGLELFLASGNAVDHKEAEAWLLTDEGKDFVLQSCADWCNASIHAGTEPSEAQAAAERTTSFYTGRSECRTDE